jgi:hypothetical protein
MNKIEIEAAAALHGLFTLLDGVSERDFLSAFEAFYEHLRDVGYVTGYRIMRRQPLEGFGAPLPSFDYHVVVDFQSLAKDQACYDYVKADEEPVRSLHRAMNSKVKRGSSYFFLGVYI